MLSKLDREKLEAAQQAVDLAQGSMAELYKAENELLAEHAYELMELLANMNKKLRRLLSITKAS